MNILIATGIYKPEIGGPATYVPRVARGFVDRGHTVSVVTYADCATHPDDVEQPFSVHRVKRAKNKVLNYVRYFLAIKKQAKAADVIYAFDHMSAGIPAAVLSRLVGTPLFVRIGGDFIWERYLQQTNSAIPMRTFYERGLEKKDPIRLWFIRRVFGQATGLIFTTKFQMEIFKDPYTIDTKKVMYIHNPLPEVVAPKGEKTRNKTLLFAGRMIPKNNIRRLVEAFVSASRNVEGFRLLLIGDGPERKAIEQFVAQHKDANIELTERVPREELWEQMREAYGVVFPSVTDISPNTMLDCIVTQTRFVSSKEIGYDWVKPHVPLFDPEKTDDIAHILTSFMKDDAGQFPSVLAEKKSYTFSEAAKDTLDLFQTYA